MPPTSSVDFAYDGEGSSGVTSYADEGYDGERNRVEEIYHMSGGANSILYLAGWLLQADVVLKRALLATREAG